MVIIGIDAHKRTHTAVACDEHGRELSRASFGTSSDDHESSLASGLARYGDRIGRSKTAGTSRVALEAILLSARLELASCACRRS